MIDERPTAESIIGTVVGKMMALRKGPNRHTKEVAEAVVQQIDLLRTLLQSQAKRIEELEKVQAHHAEIYEEKVRILQTQNADLNEAYKKLSASHNPEICVDVQEYAEKLKEENATLRATAELVEPALRDYVRAQRRMLERWTDADKSVRHQLWRDLHVCEAGGREALVSLES